MLQRAKLAKSCYNFPTPVNKWHFAIHLETSPVVTNTYGYGLDIVALGAVVEAGNALGLGAAPPPPPPPRRAEPSEEVGGAASMEALALEGAIKRRMPRLTRPFIAAFCISWTTRW